MLTEEKVEDFLAHYGVQGMRWGVRNDRMREKANSGDKRAQKTLTKKDAKWKKDIQSPQGFMKAYNDVARKMNDGLIDKFNEKHAKADHDYRVENAETKRYFDAYTKELLVQWKSTVSDIYGESPSGRFSADVAGIRDDGSVEFSIIHNTDSATDPYLKHAESDEELMTFVLERAENGTLSKVLEPETVLTRQELDVADILAQTDAIKLGEDFLSHYGVQGMRWGIRKEEATAHMNVTDPTTGKTSKIRYDPKKVKLSRDENGKVVVTGTNKRAVASVERQLNKAKPHSDHIIARETLKRPLSSVSNKDLQATNTRLNLEKQYSQLKFERSKVGQGKMHVGQVLGLLGTGAAVATAYAKLAQPDNQRVIRQGAAWIRKSIQILPRLIQNPEAVRRAMNVARLAARG